MLVCGIDFESTGLEPVADRITEIGAALVEWETLTPLKVMSTLVNPERPIPEEITKITGITDEQVDLYGKSEKAAFAELHDLMSYADYAAAFNGSNFDYPFYLAACARLGVEPSGVMWLDLSSDVKYPPEIKTRNLRHLASEHNFLNPLSHRALWDVMTMLTVASRYDINGIVARAAEPTLFVQAVVSFDEKEKAKELGFRWFAPEKVWWRQMKSSDFEEIKDNCGFKTRLLAGPLE